MSAAARRGRSRSRVEALTGRLAPATLLGDVQRVWEQAAGPAIAARGRAGRPSASGTVTLRCSSAVWMQEIDLMGPELVAQLNARSGRARAARCAASRRRAAPLRRPSRDPRRSARRRRGARPLAEPPLVSALIVAILQDFRDTWRRGVM